MEGVEKPRTLPDPETKNGLDHDFFSPLVSWDDVISQTPGCEVGG